MRSVGQGVRKKDSAALLSGKPVYTEDVSPKNCLQVVILRSPHAHAMIEEIDVSRALKAAGLCADVSRCAGYSFYAGRADVSGVQPV